MKKKSIFTRGISLLLSIIMIVSMVPLTAISSFAATDEGWYRPVDKKYWTISDGYGWRPDPESPWHWGIDICGAGIGGAKVRATKSGKVYECGYNYSMGNYVFLSHNDGTASAYMHMMTTPSVKKGQSVKQGDTLGYVGSTGYSTGNHLDFRVLKKSSFDWSNGSSNGAGSTFNPESITYKDTLAETTATTPTEFKAKESVVASGKAVTFTWKNSSKPARGYTIEIKRNGQLVTTLSPTSDRTSYDWVTFNDGDVDYTATIKALGSSDKYNSNTATTSFSTKAKVLASFYNDENVLIESKSTEWNTTPIVPANIPQKEHYYFAGWDKALGKITADTNYYAKYEKQSYKVRFFAYNSNGEVAQIGTTQTVKYLDSATAPANYLNYVRSGMEFAGWSCDFSSIEENTDIYLIEKWYNENMKIKILDGATALRDPDGYTVNCTLQNNYTDKTVGRVIVAIKTAEGKLIYTTESAAFTIKAGMKKNLEVYVPCDQAGTVAEIYAVEKYTTALPISKAVNITVDQGNSFTDWSTDPAPADALVTETKTQYRYRDKETKTSGYASLEGYERVGDKKLINTTWGAFYGNTTGMTEKNWSDVNYYYETHIQSKTVYKSYAYYNSSKVYYWGLKRSDYPNYLEVFHEKQPTYNESDGNGTPNCRTDSISELKKGASYSGYGQIYAIKDKGVDVNSYKSGGSKICLYNAGSGHRIYQLATQKYQYTHYRWLDWSEWSDTAVTANDNREVKTQTLYRYKANDVSNLENTDGTLRTVSGKVSTDFAGREADLFIYKYNEASDWTNQYIGQCTIGEDGSYSFKFKLRTEPTILTGDYTATLGIEGTSAVIDISNDYAWLKAPLPKHTVTYYNTDGSIISTQTVVEGGNAVVPEMIPEMEGYTFTGWDNSNINVTEDLIISPIMKINTYTVTFIDWENQKYEVKTFEHGDELVTPEFENVEEGYIATWDAFNSGITTVTENMVVCSVYEKQEFTVNFYDYDKNIISAQTVKYGEAAEVPELANTENITFKNWSTYDCYNVKENLDVYPVFLYDETVATPTSSVDTGVYNENFTVTLSCATEGAKILYTIDGTNPLENGIEYFEPISIKNSLELRFIAVKEEFNNSEVVKNCYALNKDDMTSDWMTDDELPDYVLENFETYSLNYRPHGYKYKDTLSISSIAQANELRRTGWNETDASWTDYTAYSEIYPVLPDNEIEILTKSAEPYDGMVYTYTHYKYYNTTKRVYEYSNVVVENTVGEVETLKLTEELTKVASFVNGKPALRYNGELWFYEKEGIETITPDYNVYSYRTKVFNFYKWTDWSINPVSSTESREYVDSEVYSYTMPNRYVVNIDYTDSIVEDIKSNDSILVIEGQKIALNEDYFNTEGYTLEGIYTDIDYKNEWNFENDIVNENVTLYPKYSVSTFTVKFLDYDNSVISEQEVKFLNYANVPEDPTRDGFVFINWECIEGTQTDGITNDITYIAKYVAEEDYTRVSLSRSKLSMITGSSNTIKATVMSSNADAELIWYSSNSDVATVDSLGNIIAVHSGTAIITVMALDTYETANCVVTVLGTLDTEILPVSNSGVIVDASAKYLLGINRGENTIISINSKLQNSNLVYTNSEKSVVYENNNTVVGTGCKIQLKDIDEVIDEVTLVIYGDVNGDGAVDAFDAIAVDLTNNGAYDLKNEYAEAADTTGDGVITSADYAYLVAIVNGSAK